MNARRATRPSALGRDLTPLQREILGVCTTDRPRTAPEIAAALGRACNDTLRSACSGLARDGRLYRKRFTRGYWLTRCRGV